MVMATETLTLIDFYSLACAPCKLLMPVLDKIETDYKNVLQLRKIDVCKDIATTSKYMIISIPTVVLTNGSILAVWRGGNIRHIEHDIRRRLAQYLAS